MMRLRLIIVTRVPGGGRRGEWPRRRNGCCFVDAVALDDPDRRGIVDGFDEAHVAWD